MAPVAIGSSSERGPSVKTTTGLDGEGAGEAQRLCPPDRRIGRRYHQE
jgi:hypothetical protein